MSARPTPVPVEIEDNLVSAKVAAHQLGVSVWTIYRWIDDRTLRGHRLGRRTVRVSQGSIDDLKNRTMVVGAPPAPPRPKRKTPRTLQHTQALARLAKLGIAV